MFEPVYVFKLSDAGELIPLNERTQNDFADIYKALERYSKNEMRQHPLTEADFILKSRVTKEEYLETITAIRKDIVEGDYYEVNYCQEFFGENVQIEPLQVFEN